MADKFLFYNFVPSNGREITYQNCIIKTEKTVNLQISIPIRNCISDDDIVLNS